MANAHPKEMPTHGCPQEGGQPMGDAKNTPNPWVVSSKRPTANAHAEEIPPMGAPPTDAHSQPAPPMGAHRATLLLGENRLLVLLGETLQRVKVEPLGDGRELPRHRLRHGPR